MAAGTECRPQAPAVASTRAWPGAHTQEWGPTWLPQPWPWSQPLGRGLWPCCGLQPCCRLHLATLVPGISGLEAQRQESPPQPLSPAVRRRVTSGGYRGGLGCVSAAPQPSGSARDEVRRDDVQGRGAFGARRLCFGDTSLALAVGGGFVGDPPQNGGNHPLCSESSADSKKGTRGHGDTGTALGQAVLHSLWGVLQPPPCQLWAGFLVVVVILLLFFLQNDILLVCLTKPVLEKVFPEEMGNNRV